MQTHLFDPAHFDPAVSRWRRRRIAAAVLLLTAPAVAVMADLHLRTGFDGWKLAHLAIFTVLFGLLAFGTLQAILGFLVRRRGGDPCRISLSVDWPEDSGALPAPTAIIMPICNEEIRRVMKGVRMIFESLKLDGRLPEFGFYILSDTSDPERVAAEAAAWEALVRELDATGRLFYRQRHTNTDKKAGNIADFCRQWGDRYRYMVVLDADSVMTGGAIVALVRLMERNPGVGLIQAIPKLLNGETVFARMQQFACRLYGPAFVAGANYWQLSEANYWGHNAIIRVDPFMKHCRLPTLPGGGPFGGHIMSHDFVEAALMRGAGWQVWLATEVEDSFEEGPANVIGYAKRDRRWLQGNLQHTRLLWAAGFHPLNRLHFSLGILSYLASPLWLAFLVLSTGIAFRFRITGLTPLPVDSFAGHLAWRDETESVVLLGLTLTLLFAPRIIALMDLRLRPADVEAFGGWRRVLAGVTLETTLSTLYAPVLMLFHTKFIALTLCGHPVGWKTQRRGHDGESEWRECALTHAGHTILGVAWLALAWWISPTLVLWMAPILLGLILSIPVSYLTGRAAEGLALRRAGILLTKEETDPPRELVRLADLLKAKTRPPMPIQTSHDDRPATAMLPNPIPIHAAQSK